MLKAGDWIEIENDGIYQIDEFGFVLNDRSGRMDLYIIDTDRYFRSSADGKYRVLYPEEVKAKRLDEKSDFVPQEPNDGVKTVSQSRNRKLKQPYTKFLFCEDGSVDTGSLEKDLRKHNPEIKVVVYRQGASVPLLVDIKESK